MTSVFMSTVKAGMSACLLVALPLWAHATSIDVFAMPSDSVVKTMQQTSDTLHSYGIDSFYRQGKPVHITLYLTEFPSSAQEKITQIVQRFAKTQAPFPITASGVTVTKGHWAFIDVKRSAALQRLADEITLALEPLRVSDPTMPDWVKAYPNKQAAFERYGSPNVFQNFTPHLTLVGGETNPNLAKFAKAMHQHPPYVQGKIVGIGVGITDKWGQQKTILGEYRFNKAQP
ncbi:2'-5' RNA ligase family protein [Vibrio zhugei]|uniref:2'-5' RNA ligase family protein n=1 Tax=Vibrio zhugei TaxID=2479546 RepID=A0ABV7CE83_9VIBR|nr:2'-5' RNA ligase family protein [Vibrio zhugei]